MKIMSQYNKNLNYLQSRLFAKYNVQAKYEFPTQENREVELKLFSSFTVLFLMAN